jgi:hypothetical protein
MVDRSFEQWNTHFRTVYTYLKTHQKMPLRASDDDRQMNNWLSIHKTMYKQGQLSEFKRGMMELLYQDFPFIGFKQ